MNLAVKVRDTRRSVCAETCRKQGHICWRNQEWPHLLTLSSRRNHYSVCTQVCHLGAGLFKARAQFQFLTNFYKLCSSYYVDSLFFWGGGVVASLTWIVVRTGLEDLWSYSDNEGNFLFAVLVFRPVLFASQFLFSGDGRINSTKSPASCAGNVSEPRLMSGVWIVRQILCA